MAFLYRGVARKSFLTLRNSIASTTGLKTSLFPDDSKKDFSYLHELHEEGEHGEHELELPYRAHAETTTHTPPRSVFNSNYSHFATRLFPKELTPADFYKRYYTTSAAPEKKKVAVILSGSGVHDGSEIHEAVSILIHLSRSGVDAKCFAPDKKQADVINHVKGTAQEETRNVLVESARIARGKIKPLSQLKAEEYSAIIFPGGYGAAKNLCTFAKDGENCSVDPEVERVLKEFHESKKPIGLCCVSPVIAAKVLSNVKITLGNEDKDINSAMERMGAKPQPAGVTDVVLDETNNIVSTPAYMCTAPIHKVYEGIGKLVDTVLGLTKKEQEK